MRIAGLREWQERRRQVREASQHDKGFGWAMVRMVRYGEPPEHLGGLVETGDDPFDQGAREAIRLYERRGA
jgi:hypothetical protein